MLGDVYRAREILITFRLPSITWPLRPQECRAPNDSKRDPYEGCWARYLFFGQPMLCVMVSSSMYCLATTLGVHCRLCLSTPHFVAFACTLGEVNLFSRITSENVVCSQGVGDKMFQFVRIEISRIISAAGGQKNNNAYTCIIVQDGDVRQAWQIAPSWPWACRMHTFAPTWSTESKIEIHLCSPV